MSKPDDLYREEPMSQDQHPRGLPPDKRKEWNEKSSRLLELYNEIPIDESPRKIIGGSDENETSWVFYFHGTKREFFNVLNMIKKL